MDKPTLRRQFRNAPSTKRMKAALAFALDGTAVVTLPAQRSQVQASGVVHGAVIAFAADTSAYYTAAAASDLDLTTACFSMNFLRPVKAPARLRATSVMVRCGRKLVIVRSQVFDGAGRQVAEGVWTHAAV